MNKVRSVHKTTTKESVIHSDGQDFKVICYFEGKETASKLLYDMAVSRVLNEPSYSIDSKGVRDE